MKQPAIMTTAHNLAFEVAEWPADEILKQGLKLFRVGTCNGLWRSTETDYEILVIDNNQPGNGHLEDVFEWFTRSCKRDNKSLAILEVMNDRFKKHLIQKRGFVPLGENSVILSFK